MVDVPESHVKPSGNLLTVCELENGPVEIVDVSHEKWWFIVDFPIKNSDL